MRRAVTVPMVGIAVASLASLAVSAQTVAPLEVAQTILQSKLPPDPLAPVERPIEDELVLEMRLGRYILSDGFLGYLNRSSVLLPLGEVAAALDFPITVDPVTGQAEGWFLRENRRFFLDIARGEVVIEGRTETLPPGLVELHFDDIYVDTTLLARWFPIDVGFDLSQLTVEITSREPLPIEERLAREQANARLGQGGSVRAVYPRLETPYRLFTVPFMDTSLSSNYQGGDSSSLTARYTTLLTGDLLFMDANVFVAGSKDEKLDNVRVTLGRKDPDAELLGPLSLTELAVGDVFTTQLPLVSSQQEGRGIAVSSFPINRATEFDRTTLRGELPLGWEVELYRNEVLFDFQQSRDDGRYEFLDVPLLFGSNVLRLIFYGPQGQLREEVQRTRVGEGLVQPREQYYSIAVNQQGEDTIPINSSPDNGTEDETQGKLRFSSEYERGLTQKLSVAGSIASIPLDDGRHTYASVGLRTSLLGAFVRLDAAKDLNGGTAVEGSLQTSIMGLNILAEHGEFFDFVSERVADSEDKITSRSSLRIDGTIPESILPRIPFSFDGDIERRESGKFDANIGNRVSVFLGGASASNTVDLRVAGGGDSETLTSASGSFQLSSRFDALSLRGQVGYGLDPVAEFNTVAFTADYDFEEDLSARVSINRQLTGEKTTSYAVGLFRTFRNFALGLNGDYSDDGNFGAGFNMSFALGREPRNGGFAMRPKGIASGGAVSARVFLDRNQNDVFDDGDEPLQGARIERQRDAETDEDGIAFITGLSAYRPTNLALDLGSLEDPFWIPTRQGIEIVPRPGKTVIVDFPVTPTGEIDGTVFLRRGDAVREVSNVQLQLVDENGEVVKEVKSEFDGFYLLDFVRPGKYVLRVSPDQVERLKLLAPPELAVVVEPEGNVVSGIDITLERVGDKKPVAKGLVGPG